MFPFFIKYVLILSYNILQKIVYSKKCSINFSNIFITILNLYWFLLIVNLIFLVKIYFPNVYFL